MALAIRNAAVPTIELRSTNYNLSLPFVGMDNSLIGSSVAEHFMNRGYRRFAAYTLDTELFFKERLENFIIRVEAAGGSCECLASQGDESPSDWEKHQDELVKWLHSLEKPIGIFATNDQLAVQVLDACQRSGISVPEEVAVVGCENETTLCEFASPTLTSVKFDGKTVGYEAAALLDRWMKGETVPKNPVLIPPMGIVVRASSDDFVIEDTVVLHAVKLIREHAFRGISVGEIASALHVSRSTLERRMKQCLKRGTKEELLRIRFQEVNRLLSNTDLTIEAISEMTGFAHPHYLQSFYRDRYGVTPGTYRRRNRN
jgi:LacI family transcriptional regulator